MSKISSFIFRCLLAFSTAGISGQAVLTSGPTAMLEGGSLRINFSVSEATDVAVWVEDLSGNMLRHLAAGVLGSPAVCPPFQSGLSQSITWDGTNDAGTYVGLDDKVVKVGLGLSVSFDKVLGWEGKSIGAVLGLAVDSSGDVYVLNCGGDYIMRSSAQIQVFDRSGAYERTVMPFPAGIPMNAGSQAMWRNSSLVGWVPRVYYSFQSFYPDIDYLARHN